MPQRTVAVVYVYYDNHWVDTSVPGAEGSYLTTEEADNSYLKLDASNDPVTGTCEFAAGVSVTGLTDPAPTGANDGVYPAIQSGSTAGGRTFPSNHVVQTQQQVFP